MAHVLPFRPRPENRFRARHPLEGPAKVVIFPGVRYERAQGEEHGPPEPSGRPPSNGRQAARRSFTAS